MTDTDRRNDAMDDHRLPEDWLEAARTYNRPRETPREEMWSAVEASLCRGSGDAAETGRADAPAIFRRRLIRWLAPAAAAAAVLAVGIGIGRMTAPVSPDMAARGDEGAVTAAYGGAGAPNTVPPAIRAVALDHLGRTESLLSLVRSDARAGRVEPDVGRWGVSLLTETRLLLDSPAADDPAMRELLEDLELILAQVALLRGDGSTADDRTREELELIARGLTEHDVLSRIQAVLPAGPETGMTGI